MSSSSSSSRACEDSPIDDDALAGWTLDTVNEFVLSTLLATVHCEMKPVGGKLNHEIAFGFFFFSPPRHSGMLSNFKVSGAKLRQSPWIKPLVARQRRLFLNHSCLTFGLAEWV